MNVAGKILVITGGGSGIGKAMAHAFHHAGAAKIVVADIDVEAADEVAAAIGGRAFACDVTDEAQIKSLIETVERD
ncbi:MAG: SDR family NAD(P)-dependent oxidoreductase, partial [Gallionella sp.]